MTSHLKLVRTGPAAPGVNAVTSLSADLSSALSARPLRVAHAHDECGTRAGVRVQVEVERLLPDFTVELAPFPSPSKAVLCRDADIAAVDLHACAETLRRDLPHGLDVAAVLSRADVRFRTCTVYHGVQLSHLAPDAKIGVSTALGRAQLRHWRPSLNVEVLEGDPDSWPGRLRIGDLDAIVFDYLRRPTSRARLSPSPLAAATSSLSGLRAVPETHSGLVGVLCRRSVSRRTDRCLDGALERLGEHLRNFAAFAAYVVEQTCLTRLRDGGVDLGDVAVHADIEDGVVSLVAVVAPKKASGALHTICQTGPVLRARDLGTAVADALRDDLQSATVIPMPLPAQVRVSPDDHSRWTLSCGHTNQHRTTT